jgi:hypothetical protein
MELNQTNFRRLVQLYLLTMVATLMVSIYEAFSPPWGSFAGEFDALVERHFGDPLEQWLLPAAALCLASLIWGLASTIGLIGFKQWARFGFWASFLLSVPILFMSGAYPSYSTPRMDLLVFFDGALFGAILLLAYSREHGGMWFNQPAKAATEG